MQNPMRPPFNQQQSTEMLQGNNAQNVMNPNLTAAQQQLRQTASQNLNRVQQMQQSMQQQLQQNLGQQPNQNQNQIQIQNQNGNQANMNNAALFNGLFPGQTNQNQQNQFNMGNNLVSGQKPVSSPQMQNAQQQQIRPPVNMPQSSPLAPGRPLQQAGVPQNLLELNQQFQQLNDQQKQQVCNACECLPPLSTYHVCRCSS